MQSPNRFSLQFTQLIKKCYPLTSDAADPDVLESQLFPQPLTVAAGTYLYWRTLCHISILQNPLVSSPSISHPPPLVTFVTDDQVFAALPPTT